jgi:hypothetical protein
MPYDYAVHSDFLIHWTGKDLDCANDPHWANGDKSTTDSVLTKKYLERLHSILKYGLWLTAEPERPWPVDVKVTIPSTPKVCFTELKLSESRNHARRYGRLGIGFKRPYLFNRRGRPLVYYGYHDVIQNDQFLKACGTDLKNKDLLNLFKPMNSSASVLNYDLYSESEWRIIRFHELVLDRERKLLVDPRDTSNTDENVFFNSLTAVDQDKLKVLAPLDGWFAMVIYPSLAMKNAAQQDDSYQIHEQISRIKAVTGDHGNFVEDRNWPIEVDLDSCRNF